MLLVSWAQASPSGRAARSAARMALTTQPEMEPWMKGRKVPG